MAAFNQPGAGQLRESLTFTYKSQTPDGAGGTVSGTVTRLTGVRARITPMMKGTEQVIAQGLQAVSTFEITVRGSSETLAITTNDTIVNERAPFTQYNIRMITNPDERNRFIVFLVQTGVAQ